MALSEHERKLLEEMERNLLNEDASFVSRVREVSSTNQSAKKLVAGVLILVVGIGLLIFAVMLQVAFFGVVAFLVMVAGLSIAAKNFAVPQLPKPGAGSGKSIFGDRWDQRFGGSE